MFIVSSLVASQNWEFNYIKSWNLKTFFFLLLLKIIHLVSIWCSILLSNGPKNSSKPFHVNSKCSLLTPFNNLKKIYPKFWVWTSASKISKISSLLNLLNFFVLASSLSSFKWPTYKHQNFLDTWHFGACILAVGLYKHQKSWANDPIRIISKSN